MRRLLILSSLLLWGPSAYSQSVRYQSQLIGSRGTPLAAQSVAVCTQPASIGTTPCSPLATLATSTSTTSGGANPTTTDINGNFFFYAAPGRYTIQIYGPQISTPFIQADTDLNCAGGGTCTITGSITFASQIQANGGLAVNGINPANFNTGWLVAEQAIFTGLAGDEVCGGVNSGGVHLLECSYNGDPPLPMPRSVNGLTFDAVYGTYRVTADQTITAGASLVAIPGLSWTMPANTALNVKFSCDLLYSQATAAASDSFGVQDVTIAPTNAEVYGRADTSATTFTAGNQPAIAANTATTVVTFTPSASATVFGAHLDGLVEQPSNAATSLFQIMAQFTTNNGTIKRGSSCQVF
jgi:hypothetical protein